ncbi:MAG: 4-hydroxyacetophenone monooxygenase [Rhodospirillaceae bacterium]|nr:4-hydroxyacetophenone monooxygenase [Rhodospirillaceae bacterium]|tara:strand:- start:1340 stop:2809 length:1470 start_codon:yes stop_codon:yes gene_type:complete
MKSADKITKDREIVIVGCGFAAVALGISLKKAGFNKFTILERAPEIGGVWRENTYPGAACDLPSRLYSFSFEQDYPWSLRYAPQNEIFEYLKHCIDKYSLTPHIRLDTEVAKATYVDDDFTWKLETKKNEEITADIFVSAVGLFNNPFVPDIAGRDTFSGAQFHSSRWDHSIDLNGKIIASIGSGASAIQFVPEIAKQAERVHVFQRTPQHIFAKGDRANAQQDHGTSLLQKFSHRRERLKLFARFEKNSRRRSSERMTRKSAEAFEKYICELVDDPTLLEKLLPDYPPGCKRGLRSDDWYPTLLEPHVHVVDAPIDKISEKGIRTTDGQFHPADVIIYGTGFTPTKFLTPMQIKGANGQDLNGAWHEGAEAYLGVSVNDFPNFFMMYGPNTNLSGSIIYMLENQARYITNCLETLDRSKSRAMHVKKEIQKQFNAKIIEEFSKTVMVHEKCRSYYQTETGRITTNWPGLMLSYRWRTRRVRKSDYIFL